MSSPDDEVSDGFSQVVCPIHGEDELDQLADLVSRSRIVLLGESTHGTREFYELRAALTRRLIAQHGFSALAIDADWPDVLPVDRYLRGLGDDESASAALASFERFPEWRWRNTEISDLVEWLRGFNHDRRPEARVGCYGLDLYALHASTRAVLSYLAELDPEAAIRARVRYACGGRAEAELGESTEVCVEELVEELVEMQRRRSARSGRAPSGESWFRAIQGARVAHRAEAYYRALIAGASSTWSLREGEMVNTLELLSGQLAVAGAPPRIVVWTHNEHVGDARVPGRGSTLGALLRERHPREVASVGFTTSGGTVACAHEWDGAPEVEDLPAAAAGSWEEVFHGIGIPRFMVTASALCRVVGERADRVHRALGAVYRPKIERWIHDAPARLAERYDVIVHVDATSALEPLPRSVPEPYDALAEYLAASYSTVP
jgi:erythromycin esterase-like protein